MKNCIVSIDTTGEISGVHEVIRLSILQTDLGNASFTSLIRPNHMENIDPKELESGRFSRKDLLERPTPMQCKQAFFNWHNEVFFGEKICLIGEETTSLVPFLRVFFGDLLFNKAFSSESYDVPMLLNYLAVCGYIYRGYMPTRDGSIDSCNNLLNVWNDLTKGVVCSSRTV
jgi:hypothetical protein